MLGRQLRPFLDCNVSSASQGQNETHVCISSQVYSCSVDGTVLVWNVGTLRVTSRFQLPGSGLSAISLHGGCLWCCKSSAPAREPALL